MPGVKRIHCNRPANSPIGAGNNTVTETKPRLNLGATWVPNSGSVFNTTDDPTEFETAFRAEAAQLDRRIVVVATIVMAELWALTAAIEAWAEGAALTGIMAFQLVGFLLAMGFWKAPVSRAYPAPAQTELAARGSLARESAAG